MHLEINILNQIFDIKQKLQSEECFSKIERNINKLYHLFEEHGYHCIDPTGEPYKESRTDYEASIVGDAGHKVITKIIKPIIYKQEAGQMQLLQKGIVIAE